jgi:transposase
VTETLEVVPRQWKVIQTVRERFSCRQCEAITQLPSPFHVTSRGFAGPSLLVMILFEKFGQHQPLNRQSEHYAFERGRPEPVDITTVPIVAKGQTETGRPWVYVRDDRPFGGKDPPAALFSTSRDRTRKHPQRHLAG